MGRRPIQGLRLTLGCGEPLRGPLLATVPSPNPGHQRVPTKGDSVGKYCSPVLAALAPRAALPGGVPWEKSPPDPTRWRLGTGVGWGRHGTRILSAGDTSAQAIQSLGDREQDRVASYPEARSMAEVHRIGEAG